MINHGAIERNKDRILNFAVLILALIIAWQFYKSANNQVGALIQRQNNEQEKNNVAREIAVLEKKAQSYRELFVKRDLASVMDRVSAVAKEAAVRIISVKPSAQDAQDNRISSSFLITLNVLNYHALGKFISKIENHPDVYLVSEVNITSQAANSNWNAPVTNAGLNVSLKINSVAYL